MTTPRQELQEALNKAMELLAEIEHEQVKAHDARARYNEFLGHSDFEAVETQVAQEIAEKEAELAAVLENDLAVARKPLEKAEQAYQWKADAAQEKRDTALAAFAQARNQHLIGVKTEYQTRLAEAEMEVHTAKQRVTNLQNSLNRHYENFKAQRGADLKVLIDAYKG